MNFYPDSLTAPQLEVLRGLAPVALERHFYLGGGTTLSIYLRHRRSIEDEWLVSAH